MSTLKDKLLDEVIKMKYPFSAKDTERLHEISKMVNRISIRIQRKGQKNITKGS